jgi:hypothetical protein
LPETGGLIDIDGGVAELGMVEEVEELRAELERRVFSDAANPRRLTAGAFPVRWANFANGSTSNVNEVIMGENFLTPLVYSGLESQFPRCDCALWKLRASLSIQI